MWPFKRREIEQAPPKSLEPKDPADHTLSESSTPWKREAYCDKCFRREPDWDVRRAGFCNHCGSFHHSWICREDRVFRKFWNGERWMYQYRYVNGLHEREQIREQRWA